MRRAIWALSLLAAGLVADGPARADFDTYLALGDSLTFGVGADQSPADVSDGDRGYVRLVADDFGTVNPSGRPDVVNLAISGETSDTFLGRAGLPNIESPDSYLRNTTYAALGLAPPQNAALLATIQSRLAAGRTIGAVSLSLGSNDLFALQRTPEFLAADPAGQLALFNATLRNFGQNLGFLLTELRTLLPAAQVYVLGSYNPFGAAAAQQDAAILALNEQAIRPVVAAFGPGVFHVDLYTPFRGRELELTFIAQGNVHPTDAGYRAIAGQILAVPEPSGLALAGLGAAAVAAVARRRRAA